MQILYVEDDAGIAALLSRQLSHAGQHEVKVAGSIAQAKTCLTTSKPELLICDQSLPDGKGLDLIKTQLRQCPSMNCIVLTGQGNEELAVDAMKAGVHDYIVKDIENNFINMLPVVLERVEKTISLERALAASKITTNRLEASNRYLSSSLKQYTQDKKLIGQSSRFNNVLSTVEQVAPTDATVLLQGETGTGKEMIAQLIHELSQRVDRPLITINSAALPEQLVESELFGHRKGAFTGAIKSRVGRFEAADGGTIFLDEIGELSLELQPKLLRVLQESGFQHIGSNDTQYVDVRVIAATNQDLKEKVENGQFRSDLYYRLNVIPINLPPLRERVGDIELLVMHYMKLFCEQHELEMPTLPDEVLVKLKRYQWPGNIRELRNYVERGIITKRWEVLPLEQFELKDEESESQPLLPLEELERRHIINVLRHTDGVVAGTSGAAEILGLHPNTLRSKMQRLQIKRPHYD